MSRHRIRCCERVTDRGMNWPSDHNCTRWSICERDGKPYCGVHDPERRKERDLASNAKYNQDNRMRMLGHFAPVLLKALNDIAVAPTHASHAIAKKVLQRWSTMLRDQTVLPEK